MPLIQPDVDALSRKKLPLYGPLDIQDYKEYLIEESKRFAHSFSNPFPRQLQVEHFTFLYQIGAGAFGTVLLVRYRQFGTFYAMKVLSKKNLVERNYVKKALNEKLILQSLNCPFTISLLNFSQDNSNIYFFLPFISGGELFVRMTQCGKFSDNESKFYAAQVILTFEYLHKCGIIYRDLKPENILLDHFGYIKLTDFGLSKLVPQRTYTFCGTPDYIAPEIILGQGYGMGVDWWALGVFMYEMSCGKTPFLGINEHATYTNIIIVKYDMPKDFDKDLKHLIENLLQSDVTKRIGNLKSGVEDVKNHPWFGEINWLALLNRKVAPPFVPSDTKEISKSAFPGMKQITDWEVAKEDLYKDIFSDF
ncbi:cAMP-dependent protein kinase catalytic subunit alpha-like [Macrosteles quadrilineatus]|uniref:cAMP-dependent protein kinase catalytic subunit alpha-like n=1 Tax=Macrosteles quadrilineatus TaxID=74068 RepID=UPI0023E0F37C|nr:cAMP-dependent protein kinase catalytic subunit alpha-like [Macrosteles quadrilineatus]